MQAQGSWAHRSVRVRRRQRRRQRLTVRLAVAGAMLVLSSVLGGLLLAQRGVADLAGAKAPPSLLSVRCGGGPCVLEVGGHRWQAPLPPLHRWWTRAMARLSGAPRPLTSGFPGS